MVNMRVFTTEPIKNVRTVIAQKNRRNTLITAQHDDGCMNINGQFERHGNGWKRDSDLL